VTVTSFTLSDTTFHFFNATPAEALRRAKQAGGDKDVRLGGGVATVREFLDGVVAARSWRRRAPPDLQC
jgi:dihydrofolate reductase